MAGLLSTWRSEFNLDWQVDGAFGQCSVTINFIKEASNLQGLLKVALSVPLDLNFTTGLHFGDALVCQHLVVSATGA